MSETKTDTLPDRARALFRGVHGSCEVGENCGACQRRIREIEQALSRERAAALEEAARVIGGHAKGLEDSGTHTRATGLRLAEGMLRDLAKGGTP